MKTYFRPAYWIAFLALCMVMGELHEQAHIQTGYWLCGCYGERDFNVWATCSACGGRSYIATLAGPLFSYLVYWICVYCIRNASSIAGKWYALAVLFATLPFARIFTAVMGGGDEKVFITAATGGNLPVIAVRILAIVVVSLFCLPPILIAAKQLPVKRKWIFLLGLNIGPLLFAMLWQWKVMNKILASGILAQPYAGTPLLIWIHFFVMLILFYCFRRRLLPQQL